MSIIQPQGILKLCRGVPLDPSQKNTIYFGNEAARQSYFNSKAVLTLTGLSYIRKDEERVRIQGNVENYINCNYIIFENQGFSTKYIYAFIIEVKYINNATFDVIFKVDDLQTWGDQVQSGLKSCYVEREHSTVDAITQNTEPEPVPIGNRAKDTKVRYINLPFMHAYEITKAASQEAFMPYGNETYTQGVWISQDYNCANEMGVLYDGIYGGGDGGANTWGIRLIPESSATNIIPGYAQPGYSNHGGIRDTQYAIDLYDGTINGYTPKNKKCFTEQFYKISITNADGEQMIFSLEDFLLPDQENQYFNLVECVDVEPSVCLFPVNFRSQGTNYNNGLSLGAMPQCALTIDNYQAFLNQNQNSIRITQLNSAFNLAQAITGGLHSAGAMAGMPADANMNAYKAEGSGLNAAGGILGALEGIASQQASIEDVKFKPDTVSGLAGSNGYMKYKKGLYKFTFRVSAPDYACIKKIDDFFSVYGYATNAVKVPNISARPHWNYVKTRGCKIVGNMPADAIARCQSFFDSGITYWKNAAEVGNYSLDNSI